MLLNLIYLLSALVATGLWLLTDALWVWPLGFVVCFLLSLLICFLIVLYETKRSDPTIEHTTDDPFIRGIVKLYAPRSSGSWVAGSRPPAWRSCPPTADSCW